MIRIVVPMGGEGRQFVERGYTFPKPLVEVAGRPLSELVVRNLTPAEAHQFVFICKAEHVQKYALGDVLRLVAPGCEIVTMSKPTAGALCSVLLGMEHLRHDDELLIANADQWVDVPVDRFIDAARTERWDGGMMTYRGTLANPVGRKNMAMTAAAAKPAVEKTIGKTRVTTANASAAIASTAHSIVIPSIVTPFTSIR